MDKKMKQQYQTGIKHLVLITDGHRRWARKHNLTVADGYRKLIDKLPSLLRCGWGSGINTITVVIGTTNSILKRPKDELAVLYKICVELCDEFFVLAKSMNAKVIYSGRKERIPTFLQERFCELERETQGFSEFVLNIAFDYGGRDEIVLAVKEIIKNKISYEAIDEGLVSKFLYSSNLTHPEPELVIRTGAVSRLSGLVCWDYEYSELYFSPKHFPEFTSDDLVDACKWFDGLERRFGK